MNIRDIQDISDIMTLNKEDLKNVLKQLREINRGRVKSLIRLEKQTEYSSPALSHYDRVKSIKNKNLNELRNIFKKEYSFYNAQTSTIKGAKNYMNEVVSRFGKDASKKTFWDAFEIFKRDSNFLYLFGDSNQIRIFADFYDENSSLEEMFDNMENYLKENYEATQKKLSKDLWNELIENDEF